ncbi:MAG: 3'-5' exonuclease [Prevotellaceae bacterium]|jgi:DNA polymerase elongation subunit (family B)|nr:3'-5' exonuclease [Prevotellaceae bacterium]
MISFAVDKILFLDIETVPQTASLEELPENMQALWADKFTTLRIRMPEKYPADTTAAEAFEIGAGIYAEFAKIVCISVGFIYFKGKEKIFRVKSFAGDSETDLLTAFSTLLNHFITTNQHHICGHNIKEFDIPFICRRLLINGLPIPETINITGKKPWETSFIDTLELWKFGDYKNYTSLKLLTAIFGIPTPKEDIDGAQVAAVYYKERDINRISAYCEKDVIATARLYLRLCGLETIPEQCIQHA